jgi:hypothetical protein
VTPHQEHLALAGFAMSLGLLGRLHAKGLITTAETAELMDGALLWLEELRVQDDVVVGTRAVLDELLEHIWARHPDPNSPSTGP